MKASLDLVALETNAPILNKQTEKVCAYYENIIAHTSHPALKRAVEGLLEEYMEAYRQELMGQGGDAGSPGGL